MIRNCFVLQPNIKASGVAPCTFLSGFISISFDLHTSLNQMERAMNGMRPSPARKIEHDSDSMAALESSGLPITWGVQA